MTNSPLVNTTYSDPLKGKGLPNKRKTKRRKPRKRDKFSRVIGNRARGIVQEIEGLV